MTYGLRWDHHALVHGPSAWRCCSGAECQRSEARATRCRSGRLARCRVPPNPFAGETGWIAYYSGDGIGLNHPDGTGRQWIATDVPGDVLLAEWSPDGTRLTYWRNPYTNGEPTGTAVYIINADGTGEQRLTDPAMFAGSPDWSPDGEWLVFATYPLLEFQCCQMSKLYRTHPDGSGMEQLTHSETEDLRATQPRYTPDGQLIVFTAVTPSSRSLWAIPVGGGEPVVLAAGDGFYTHGTWQPTPAT